MMEILPSVVISPHPHFPNSPNIRSINAPQFPNGEEDGEIIEREEDDLVANPTSPFIPLDSSAEERKSARNRDQSPILALLLTVLRKSVVMTCSVEKEDSWEIEISRPTDVRHVAHVTFDRFNGFLGLPDEFEPEVPRRAPSASASVFGVSAESMQCSYDARGNSVPTILLMIQRRLYSDGGLQSEGIFRINAENGQEEYVRDQLNRGVVPFGVDLHCLAGLIKAWFRELPRGILDSLSPDQVMQCNSEEDCTQLVELLPPTEAALLDWAINLMADVVQCEHLNKMNAHNIAMVFAPNMTQMADPLTALIHAVQVMNFLKTLIIKRLRERDDSIVKAREQTSCSGSPSDKDNPSSLNSTQIVRQESQAATPNNFYHDASMFFRSRDCMSASDIEDSFRSFGEECIADNDDDKFVGSVGSPGSCRVADADENGCRRKYANGDVEGFLDRLRLRRGVRKMCLHPIFKLSRPGKKNNNGLGIVSSSVGSEEAWA